MKLPLLLVDLALILATGALVSWIFGRLKQPVVLGYLVAGALLGGTLGGVFGGVRDHHGVEIWAEIGVIFLMFNLGLEFSFRKLSNVGISPVLTALFEMSILGGLGYSLARLLGFQQAESVVVAALVSVSSTTIIYKALDELKLKTRRFSELIFAILIVEDLIAILILVGFSSFSQTHSGLHEMGLGLDILLSLGQLILVTGTWFLVGYVLVPGLMKRFGSTGSEELITVSSVALCFALVVLASQFGYSAALGAFIMGSVLAESGESHRIRERLEPLRDVFSAVFFVSVGMLIDVKVLWDEAPLILSLAALVWIGKTVAVSLGSLLSGQTLRTSVQAGFGMAQIGEFSFIIVSAAVAMKLAPARLAPIAVSVSVLTTFTTPYLIKISHKFAVFLEGKLPFPIKNFLNRYAAWSQKRRADSQSRSLFYRKSFRYLANAILVVSIFLAIRFWVQPKLTFGGQYAGAIAWATALVLSFPFLYGMWSAFLGFSFDQNSKAELRGGTELLSQAGVFVGLGVLSLHFFPEENSSRVWLIAVAVAFLCAAFFFRKIGTFYQVLEKQFLSTFEKKIPTSRKVDLLREFAPWDAHLVRLKVHPNSAWVKQKIGETMLRGKYGLNMVAIQRGIETIIAPRSDEMILPKDELLLLGTDDQIEMIRAEVERPPGLKDRFRDLEDYAMRQVEVAIGATIIGKSIREAGAKELDGTLVVGVERGRERILNPDPKVVLKPGDLLLVVGSVEQLEETIAQLTSGLTEI